MKAYLFIYISIILAACSTTTKPVPSSQMEKIVPGFSGKFCQYTQSIQLGGIAVSKNEGSYQDAIGKCFHAWPKGDMVVIFIDDDTEQTSEEEREEMLDELIHPQNYLTDAEVAEIDCTDGSECKKKIELLKHGVIIHFNSGKYEPINVDDLPKFSKVAGEKHVYVMVVGHTDNTFTKAFNKKLSKNRAERVKSLLVSAGLQESQVSVDWKGDSMPIDNNDSESGRANNRRSEVSVQVK